MLPSKTTSEQRTTLCHVTAEQPVLNVAVVVAVNDVRRFETLSEPQWHFKIKAWKMKYWHHQAGGREEGRPEVPPAKRFINTASERHRLVSELQPNTIKEMERLVDLTQNIQWAPPCSALMLRRHTHASRV